MKYLKLFEDYTNLYQSDIIRIQLINDFLENCKENPDYNIELPDYNDLIDDWDGYDDQTYIQNNGNEFIYWEGWVRACWQAAYKKPEYKDLGKDLIIEKIIKERFPRIAEEVNYKINNYDYFRHDGIYIMKITFTKT